MEWGVKDAYSFLEKTFKPMKSLYSSRNDLPLRHPDIYTAD